MASAKRTGRVFLLAAALGLSSLALSGCGGKTYTYRCQDGTQSKASSEEEARQGCESHGGTVGSATVSSSRGRSGTRRMLRSSRRKSKRR